MKIETIQIILNWFSTSQKVFMIRFRQVWFDSKVNQFKIAWNDSHKVRNFVWYHSSNSESIQRFRKRIFTLWM